MLTRVLSKSNLVGSLLALLAASAVWRPVHAWTPPTPDHIVIVIEENHSFDQVIGSVDAQYINSLANGGALFTNFYAITHPSQPNYLQLFSGANQGVFDNNVPAGIPFSTPNLGAALLTSGVSFAGYSEDLPEVGSNAPSNGYYMRKHNPWVNWQADPTGANQLPPAVNRPFFVSANAQPFFGDCNAPRDYSTLPRVCFVVPNQLNDMHDGTIAQADDWLELWIKPYVDWAMTHNSLFILTFDEDNSASRNRIPTIFFGPMVRQGSHTTTFTLHNLQRTIEDMFNVSHSGSAANVRSVVGAFTSDVSLTTRRFQQGVNSFADAHDTFIEQASPSTSNATITPIVTDGSRLRQVLIRFGSVFGNGSTQVPVGATILSAKLMILTGPSSANGDTSANSMQMHRMIASWPDSATWNSMVSGISADNIEAASSPDFALIPNVLDAWAIFDVTNTVQLWANASDPNAANRGWAILPTGTDGWRAGSAELATATDRPVLEITYRTPCMADVDHNWVVSANDLLSLINAWGPCGSPCPPYCAADVTHDCVVNANDLLSIINGWGPCP